MSGIQNGVKLSEISIPGTHDSCARFGGSAYQCQWFSITQQLNRGVRFLDVRCRYQAGGESGRKQNIFFPIYHGTDIPESQCILFEEVQAQCIAFLSENPSEVVVMNVQMEYSGDGDEFRKKFLELIEPYKKKHWYLGNTIPTLDNNLRGKIVLIRAYDAAKNAGWGRGSDSEWQDGASGGGLEWNGFDDNGESSNTVFQTQNKWKSIHGSEKGDLVEKYIKNSQANAANGKLTLNFASYTGDSGIGPNADGMNKRLQGFLRNFGTDGNWGAALGIIPLDFIGNTGDTGSSLENLIIEHQLHQAADTTYNGIPLWLTNISA